MKKLVALLLAAMMLVVSFAMAETPEGYPEVKEGIDLGGATITIYDYWSGDGERAAEPDEETQLQYDYHDWLMETYNCTIEQKQVGDWGSISQEMVNWIGAPDNSYRLYILPPGFVGGPLTNNYLAKWDGLVNFEDEKWNDAAVDFMTKGGSIYGVATGNSEPRQCLFFNKRVLEDAGIDWNTIYDMQAEGTWTWEAFEEMLKKITKDTDNDGVNDVWGWTGFNSDLWLVSVFSNGGTFFDFDDEGKLVVTANCENTIEALNWAKEVWNTYAWQGGEGAAWDFFKDAFKAGNCGFYMYQLYGGLNSGNDSSKSELADMEDEWGVVAFPVGPKGTTYVSVVSDNIVVIPNVYDEETTAKLAFIYDMYVNPTPGVDNEFAWIGDKYNWTDDRAVDETYAMLREAEHGKFNKSSYLGDDNSVFGNQLFWVINNDTPAALIEAAMPAWQSMLDTFNGVAQ